MKTILTLLALFTSTTVLAQSYSKNVVMTDKDQVLTNKTFNSAITVTSVANPGSIPVNAFKLFAKAPGNIFVTSTAHGERQMATLSGDEVFTNKAFNSAILVTHVATHANPPASSNYLYFKSDDNLYKKTSAGVESQVGSSSGGGLNTAFISNNGTASITQQTGAWVSSVNRASAGQVDLTITGYTANPICVASAFTDSGAIIARVKLTGTSTTNVRVILENTAGTPQDLNFTIHCNKE